MKLKLAIVAAVVGMLSANGEKQPFERYQSIIDRMPFGQPPPNFDPTRDPSEVSRDEYNQNAAAEELTQEQEAIQKAVRFSVINVEPDGSVRVGFSDIADSKSPRHYYLAVGETRNGWLVKEADAMAKSMTVVKDGIEVKLALGENSGGDAGGGKGRRGADRARSALLNRGAGVDPAIMSHRGRRERREAEERANAEERRRLEEERKREEAERARREEEERAQREAERAEQREQLNILREELRRQREMSAAAAAEKAEQSAEGEAEVVE